MNQRKISLLVLIFSIFNSPVFWGLISRKIHLRWIESYNKSVFALRPPPLSEMSGWGAISRGGGPIATVGVHHRREECAPVPSESQK